MPPVVQHSNAALYTAETLTEVTVFEGRSHLLPAQRGWEEIADYALGWAERHALAEDGLTMLASSSSRNRAVKNDRIGADHVAHHRTGRHERQDPVLGGLP
jgi:hypothetical protein